MADAERALTEDQGEPVRPVSVQVQPVAVRWQLQHVSMGGQQFVIVQFEHPMGVTAFFFDPPAAEAFARSLQQEANAARLEIASVVPDGIRPPGG
jgi:hypothetical protein